MEFTKEIQAETKEQALAWFDEQDAQTDCLKERVVQVRRHPKGYYDK